MFRPVDACLARRIPVYRTGRGAGSTALRPVAAHLDQVRRTVTPYGQDCCLRADLHEAKRRVASLHRL